ncbi:hypothetical protein [Streptomyces sp. gb14]|uniref:hypothetical protein n=1 Tax=Streptomyces sp. gb14 TaxID=1827753 RepID=UPI000BEFC52F|nr:hypothetical protein [Streptomyces sp. gb14]
MAVEARRGPDRRRPLRGLGQQYLTLALREDVDGESDFGFDVALPCPCDPECNGQAWAPAYSVTDLHKALAGAMDNGTEIVCTVHGGPADVDHDRGWDDDPEGRADLEAQALGRSALERQGPCVRLGPGRLPLWAVRG